MSGSIAEVQEFLRQHRIAAVGLSRNPAHFSRAVYKELADRHYEVVPVHPDAEEIDGLRTFHHVSEIPDSVDAALVMTPPEAAPEAVRECLEAGVRHIWLVRNAGRGPDAEEAARMCQEAGVEPIAGECPLMFLDHAAWFHRLHGWGLKVAGKYPN